MSYNQHKYNLQYYIMIDVYSDACEKYSCAFIRNVGADDQNDCAFRKNNEVINKNDRAFTQNSCAEC